MIPIDTEKPITLAEATSFIPGIGGKTVHYQTVHRWAIKGLRGVKLETVVLGGRRCTSVEAIQRFAERITMSRDRQIAPPASTRKRKLSHDTERLMREHGLCQ